MNDEQPTMTKEQWKREDRKVYIKVALVFIGLVIFALFAFVQNPIAAIVFIPLLVILALFF